VGEDVQRKTLIASLLAATLFAVGLAADAMTVQPVVVELQTSGRGMSQTVSVENTFTNALPVELRVEDLGFAAEGLTGTGQDSGDLLVFPPQALIQPGQTQVFRIQYVGEPAIARSKHFYVTVAQLPVQLPEGQSAIQILYNFRVLASVAPPNTQPALRVVSAEIARDAAGQAAPAVTITNDSVAHGYMSQGRLRIVQRDSTGREVFRRVIPGPELQQTIGLGLVGAGQTRRVVIPVTLPVDGGEIEADFTAERRR
jgi:P pilus assembly chaperone PapD